MELQHGEQLLALMRGFQVPCVLAAGADLDVFNLLAAAPLSAVRDHASAIGLSTAFLQERDGRLELPAASAASIDLRRSRFMCA